MFPALKKASFKLSIMLAFCSYSSLIAQNKGNEKEKAPVSYGKIVPVDFDTEMYKLDSSASSVIVADIGSSKIQGNNKGWFSLIHTHYRRVHILDKNDYDLADVAIRLYVNGSDQEKLMKVKAKTYNLVGGKIETAELSSKDIFTDKGDKNHITKKFTLPNVKEGAIIEYEYTVSSDFLFNFQPWSFQGTIPRLWSEYTVEIPEFLEYVSLSYGYNPMYIHTERYQDQSFSVQDQSSTTNAERFQFTKPVRIKRMVMKNVPALKEESFTSTLANHISRIEFQLSGYREPLAIKRVMGDWKTTCNKLLTYEDFGAELYKDNKWLGEIIHAIAPTDSSALYRAKAIYNYVRSNFKCNGRYGIYMTKAGLKNVVKDKGGKIADINLLLTAMLQNAKIDAHAVILSTSDNGVAHAFYPLINQYNYVISKATIDGKTYLLDGSQPRLPFGTLLPKCYNGVVRTVYGSGDPMYLSTDSLKETSQIFISLTPDDKGTLKAALRKTPGNYESVRLRAQFDEDGVEGLRKNVEGRLGTGMVLDSVNLLYAVEDNLPPTLLYDYSLNNDGEALISINPLQAEATKKNPFSSTKRNYPIEMPYGFDETLHFSLQVPKGYVVDELPKNLSLSLDEALSCTYRYYIEQNEDRVEVLSKFVFNRANFSPEEYESLRAFFELVVKKQNEDVVLKKI